MSRGDPNRKRLGTRIGAGRRPKRRGILAQRLRLDQPRALTVPTLRSARLTVLCARSYDRARLSGGRVISIVVYRTWNDLEAQLIKGILEQYGIPVRLATDISHALYPFTVDGLGETRILVPIAAEDEAQTILAGHRSTTGRLDA